MNATDQRTSGARLRVFRALAEGRRVQLALAGGLVLVSTAATLAVPLAVQRLVADLGRGTSPVDAIVAMAVLAVGGAVTAAWSAFLFGRAGERMVLDVRSRFVAHVLRLPLPDARREGTGNLVSRVTSDTMLLRSVVDVGVTTLPRSALTVAVSLVIMGLLEWVLLLVVVVTFGLAAVAISGFVVGIRRNVSAQQSAVAQLAQKFTAAVTALPTIKAYRAGSRSSDAIAGCAVDATRAAIAADRFQAFMSPLMGLGQQVAIVGVVAGSGIELAAGRLTSADFAAFMMYLLQLIAPLTVVMTGAGRLQAGLAAARRIDDILAVAGERSDARTSPQALETTRAAVEFERVSFGYDARPVLRDVSFAVPARGMTAIVGPSGAGKTTLLNLVERFLHPTDGQIRVLGHDIGAWPFDELRRRIAYVDQNFTLVEGTLRENLLLGRDDPPDDAALLRTLDEVGLGGAARVFPDGLDTVIGRESDLSGGQRQRLAIGRALLVDADLVLLDEPSSQLDSLNEDRLRALIESLARDRAVLVVAHRISTVRDAVGIVVLQDGEVVDVGPHNQLMTRCQHYRDLVRGQMLVSEASDER